MSEMPDSTTQADEIMGRIPEILKRRGSLIEIFTSDKIVIRRSMAARVVLSFAVLCLVAMVCGFLTIALTFRSGSEKEPIGFMLFLVALALILVPGILFLLPQTGPLRLECDLQQRTYRFTCATPLIKTTTGPLSDFESVSVQTYTTSGPPSSVGHTSRVLLTWKNPPLVMGLPSTDVIAYIAQGPDDAGAMARSLSARLGMPMA